MAVDFRDLRFKLENLDVWAIQEKKDQSQNLVNDMDGESLRALSLMAAKRHTVLHPSDGTKTFDLLENVIVGLHSQDCVDLAKQTISIAPDWILRTFLLASVSRFNSVDQLALREVINNRSQQLGDEAELSPDELAEAQQLAAEAAAHAAAVERGEVVPDAAAPTEDKKGRNRRAAKEKPVRGSSRASKPEKAPREKRVKMTPAERAAANRAKKPPVLTKADPNVKVKKSFLTGKPKV